MVSEEYTHLHSLSKHKGWKIIKEDLESRLKAIDTATENQIASGASFEEIGKNTVVVNLAKSVIMPIFTKIQDAIEAVEEENDK